MAEEPLFDLHLVSNLLYPIVDMPIPTEEKIHPWRPDRSQPFVMPFLGIWDHCSGSQPNEENCMMSRAPHQRLDTFESRKTSLTTHLNYKEWSPTPCISFTDSEAAVEDLAAMRSLLRKRGNQTLIVIDPDTRLRNGLPVLDVVAEMEYYNIVDPYGKSNQYYNGHYICLWQVTEREIVGH